MFFFPTNSNFFSTYHDLADTLHTASRHLSQIKLGSKTAKKHVTAIQKLELIGDDILHGLLHEIDRTFVTPFDHEDMHNLAKGLNKILDQIENVSTGVLVYGIKGNGQEFDEYADLIEQSIQAIEDLIKDLAQKSKHLNRMKATISLLHTLEKRGDVLTRRALAHLFTTKKNAITIVKWKHVFDNLEVTLNSCEEVADIVDSIIIKNY